MDKYDSKQDTLEHISKVRKYLHIIAYELALRAEKHDASKLKTPEKEMFDEVIPKLKGLTYGSEEYKLGIKELGTALQHHYQHNRHHPEFYESKGIRGMNLADVIEMFCDWCAATFRNEDGNIGKSIDIQLTKLEFGEVLANIFVNTAQEYEMGQRSHVAYRKD